MGLSVCATRGFERLIAARAVSWQAIAALVRHRRGSGGGARDVVQYSVTVGYNRLFPAALTWGGTDDDSMTVRTVLRNQPWDKQTLPTVVKCK